MEAFLRIINQTFEIEKKAAGQTAILRHVERIKNTFEELGYQIHNPIGERYDETRTDCDASIAGAMAERLVVKEVIKPIIRQDGRIIQNGVVIVEGV